MEQPDYSDLWKFITSIGVVLIVAAVGAPVALSAFGVSIIGIDPTKTTPGASIDLRNLLLTRALTLNRHLWTIAVIIFAIGLIVLLVGARKWYVRQLIRDEGENIQLKLAKSKLKPLSRVLAYSLSALRPPSRPNESPLMYFLERSPDGDEKPATSRSRALQLEDEALSQLRARLSNSFEIISQREWRDVQYDVICLNRRKTLDVLLELKYLNDPMSVKRMPDWISQVDAAVSNYRSIGRRVAAAFLVVLIDEEAFSEIDEQMDRTLQQALAIEKPQYVNLIMEGDAAMNREEFWDNISTRIAEST